MTEEKKLPDSVVERIEKESILFSGPSGMWSLEAQKQRCMWHREGYKAGATNEALKAAALVEALEKIRKIHSMSGMNRHTGEEHYNCIFCEIETAIKYYNQSI